MRLITFDNINIRRTSMYGIRHKKTQEFLKLVAERENYEYFQLGFAPAVELNYYVNDSLGFIANILLRNTDGDYEYEPELMSHIDQNELEVVSLIDNKVIPLSEVLDGQEVDCLPDYKKEEEDDIEFFVRDNDGSIKG
tara:strand:- start:39568 stop:39981 length:414 start_codon:yes stop_codon:yes gene_type:complete